MGPRGRGGEIVTQAYLVDMKLKPREEPQGLMAKKAFTTGEVAKLTGLSQQTVIRCFDSGRIGGFRIPGSTSRRIPREELIRFMGEHDIPLDEAGTLAYRVLLIDDDPNTIEVVTQALEAMDRIGLDVASNAWEAGMMAASTDPDMVIISARLHDLNMEQVCRTLQGRGESKPMQLIALARRFRGEEMELLRQLGVQMFLRPPLKGKQIIDLLPSKLTR